MKLTQDFLFLTYCLKSNNNGFEVICRGCREIVCPDYELPSYINGMIKLDGNFVTVIDPGLYFRGKQSKLNNLACILVIEHIFKCWNFRTGIIIEDIDDIMHLAAGGCGSVTFIPSTFNMKFVLNVLKNEPAEKFLSNTQMLIDLNEKQKSGYRRYLRIPCDTALKKESLEMTEYEAFNTNEFLMTK